MKLLCTCAIGDQSIMGKQRKYIKLEEEEEDIAAQQKDVESRALKLYKTFLLGLAMLLSVRKEFLLAAIVSFKKVFYFRVPYM